MLKEAELVGARRSIGLGLPYYLAYYYRYADSKRIRNDLLVLAALSTLSSNCGSLYLVRDAA